MAQIRTVDLSAKNRLKLRTKGYQEREPYRHAVLSLTSDSTIEIEPEEGETVRKIKLNLARAAKEVSREVKYGETHDGSVVAWLADGDGAPRRRRGRPRKSAE
jgi:IS30 family transposase